MLRYEAHPFRNHLVRVTSKRSLSAAYLSYHNYISRGRCFLDPSQRFRGSVKLSSPDSEQGVQKLFPGLYVLSPSSKSTLINYMIWLRYSCAQNFQVLKRNLDWNALSNLVYHDKLTRIKLEDYKAFCQRKLSHHLFTPHGNDNFPFFSF